MSTHTPTPETHRSPRLTSRGRTVAALVASIALLKGLDAITTTIGLQLGYTEANPLTAAAIDSVGVDVALVSLAGGATIAVVAIVETGCWVIDRFEHRFSVMRLRIAGYAFFTTTAATVVVWNAAVIGGVL